MKVPPNIQLIAYTELRHMTNEKRTHFSWEARRKIYSQFRAATTTVKGNIAHQYLAVIVADHVIDVFNSAFPEDDLPARLLKQAKLIVRKKARKNSTVVESLLEDGYNALGLDAILWRGTTNYPAEYAGFSCYKALLEATGCFTLLDDVETICPAKRLSQDSARITEEEIAHLAAHGDTASAAAMAVSCKKRSVKSARSKAQAFWEWWVVDGLRKAWQRV